MILEHIVFEVSHILRDALALALQSFLLAALPFTLAPLLVERRAGRMLLQVACVAACMLVATLTLNDWRELILGLAAGFSYYLLAACATYPLSILRFRGTLAPAEVGFVCLTLYLLIPALLFPSLAAMPTITFGWTAMLAAYSYCMDAGRLNPRTGLRDCLFFVLLDPNLVYALRARLGPVKGEGARRIIQGLALVLLAKFVDGLARSFLRSDAGLALSTVTRECIGAAAMLSVLYAGFLGLALFRTGLLATSGYRTSECFVRPYSAKSPGDFWRRWNTWVGNWAHRAIFLPLATASSRWKHPTWRRIALGGSVVATFTGMGLLHDSLIMISEHKLLLPFTGGFAIAGCAVVLWDMFERTRHFQMSSGRLRSWLFAGCARAVTAVHLVLVLRVIGFL